MVVWKRCIWASTLFLANIYALLLTLVVLQLIYYQHNIVIEEQVVVRPNFSSLHDLFKSYFLKVFFDLLLYILFSLSILEEKLQFFES